MNEEKIVDFHTYCPRCIHWETAESEEPCHECLENPVNTDSRRPVLYEEDDERPKSFLTKNLNIMEKKNGE